MKNTSRTSPPIKKIHALLHLRANIWLTTAVVLGVIVSIIFTQLVGLFYDPYSPLQTAGLFNTSNAGAIALNLTQRGTLEKLMSGITDAARFAVTPNATLPTQNQTASNTNTNSTPSGNGILTVLPGGGFAIGGRPIPNGGPPYTELPTGNCPGITPPMPALSAPAITQGRQGSLPNVANLLLGAGSDPGNGLAFSSAGYQGGGGKAKVQMDYILQYGDGKTTSSWFGPGHTYAAPGHFNLLVNAWYLCWGASGFDAHGRPSSDGVDFTKPMHMAPESPASTFPITVVTPEDAQNAVLGGPDLIIKNVAYGDTAGGAQACEGTTVQKCVVRYRPYDQGGPQRIQVMSISLKNLSDQPTTVSKIRFDDTSTFAVESLEKVWLKSNGQEIASMDFTLHTRCGRDGDVHPFLIGDIPLATPLALGAHETKTIDMEAHIKTAACNGRLIPADISHSFCVSALALPGQAIPPLQDNPRAPGFNWTEYVRYGGGNAVKQADGTFIYQVNAGCGRGIVMRNNPDTSLDQHNPDVGS